MDSKPASPQSGIAGVFSRAAKTYDRVGPQIFGSFGEHLVDLANIKPGSQVLDVAVIGDGVFEGVIVQKRHVMTDERNRLLRLLEYAREIENLLSRNQNY